MRRVVFSLAIFGLIVSIVASQAPGAMATGSSTRPEYAQGSGYICNTVTCNQSDTCTNCPLGCGPLGQYESWKRDYTPRWKCNWGSGTCSNFGVAVCYTDRYYNQPNCVNEDTDQAVPYNAHICGL